MSAGVDDEWQALTVFGGILGAHESPDAARRQVLTDGLGLARRAMDVPRRTVGRLAEWSEDPGGHDPDPVRLALGLLLDARCAHRRRVAGTAVIGRDARATHVTGMTG